MHQATKEALSVDKKFGSIWWNEAIKDLMKQEYQKCICTKTDKDRQEYKLMNRLDKTAVTREENNIIRIANKLIHPLELKNVANPRSL